MLSPERRKFTFHDGSIDLLAVDRLLNNLTACNQRDEHFGNIVTGRIVDQLVKRRQPVFPSNRQLDIPPQQTARIMIQLPLRSPECLEKFFLYFRTFCCNVLPLLLHRNVIYFLNNPFAILLKLK